MPASGRGYKARLLLFYRSVLMCVKTALRHRDAAGGLDARTRICFLYPSGSCNFLSNVVKKLRSKLKIRPKVAKMKRAFSRLLHRVAKMRSGRGENAGKTLWRCFAAGRQKPYIRCKWYLDRRCVKITSVKKTRGGSICRLFYR